MTNTRMTDGPSLPPREHADDHVEPLALRPSKAAGPADLSAAGRRGTPTRELRPAPEHRGPHAVASDRVVWFCRLRVNPWICRWHNLPARARESGRQFSSSEPREVGKG